MSRKDDSRKDTPNAAPAALFRRALLAWFDANRRDLPWRRSRDPYVVWVSEAMLQQTRVEVVRPRFGRFLERFPDIQRLAEAREEEVLAEWSGLGYYGRARNLHAAARLIVREHGGVFPRDPTKAKSLPGVGTYTAHAVLSIAYGLPHAVVDGNVARVLARLQLLPARPPRILQEEAERLLDPVRSGDANQALMELGAVICLPATPRCEQCPVSPLCAARRTGRVAAFPNQGARVTRETEAATLWVLQDRRGRIWLERRESPPLRGLWMLPWRSGGAAIEGAQRIAVVRHAIMDRRYRCEIWRTTGPPRSLPEAAPGPGRWVGLDAIADLPHSSLLEKALAAASREERP